MRDHDDLPYIVIERRSGGLTPFLWGALLGAGVALLLAPRSGAETQEEIRRTAQRVRDGVEGRVTRTRDRVQERIDGIREAVDTRVGQARTAVETGRRVARDARSELERRVAEAKQSYQSAAERVRGTAHHPPAAELVVTEVTVEEAEGQPDLG